MKRTRLTAMLLSLCMMLQPLTLASAETAHTHETENETTIQEAAVLSITQEDGSMLPERYTVGDALRVSLQGSEAAAWRYAIDCIGYTETIAVDKLTFNAEACDAGTAAVRALKGFVIDDIAGAALRISALDSGRNILCETEIPLDVSAARIVLINGLPLPEAMTHGQLYTIAPSNGKKIARWQYKLSTEDGESLSSTASSSTDVSKMLDGCLQSALRFGSVDLSKPLQLQITGYDEQSAQTTNTAVIRVNFESSSMLSKGGAAIPAYLSENALLGKEQTVVLQTASGAEAQWTIRAYDKTGTLIGEETTEPTAEKEILYAGLTMAKDRYARHIRQIEVTVTEGDVTSEPVSITIGYGGPACGQETQKNNAHYVRGCGHYRCDGYDHSASNCGKSGHCDAYHTKHGIRCSSCRVRLCSEDGYNPVNCHVCDTCNKMLCSSQDLDHTPCPGCNRCLWTGGSVKHEQCGYCGLYFCSEEGRGLRHTELSCSVHGYCDNGGIYHKRGECGISGHYTCDGSNHTACPTCKVFDCSEEYAYINHDKCEICGMRHCNKNYTQEAHELCDHCGDWLCRPETDHRPHYCGVEGHYRCDGRWHNTDLIDKYCDATPQHRKCEGDPMHYCDSEDGGCGQNFPCSQSNRHTRCTMCGLRWCDRSNGGHETPCGVRAHRPCQVSRFRRSEHLDCEHCGTPKCVGMHATCGDPFTCSKCYAKYYKPGDHTRDCGHLECAKGDHEQCSECEGYYCDTTVHIKNEKDGSITCIAPKPEEENAKSE